CGRYGMGSPNFDYW
nr:immunoglobulin heavy chain junction region [Macaca mulatta]